MSSEQLRRQAEAMLAADRRAGRVGDLGNPLAKVEPLPAGTLSEKGVEHLVSMTFMSSNGGTPHIVTLGPDGVVRCTCQAMLSIETRPALCWAAQDFRRVRGMHEP